MDWEKYFNNLKIEDENFPEVVQDFVRSNENWEEILRTYISSEHHWKAISILRVLNETQQQQMFNEILELACGRWTAREVYIFRKIIVGMKKTWSNEELYSKIVTILKETNEDLNYSWAIGMLVGMEEFELANRIVENALEHDDSEINEVGREFQEILKDPSSEKVRKYIEELRS